MKKSKMWLVFSLIIWVLSCDSADDQQGLYILSNTFDFNESDHGWQADFTNYPVGITLQADSIYEWKFAHTELPPILGTHKKGLMLSANNASGDLFMFIKKKIDGLHPSTDYTLVFEVDLISNSQTGEDVFFKAGGSPIEPKKVIEGRTYSLNIDQGTAFSHGEDAWWLGQIASDSNISGYSLITKNNSLLGERFIVRTNSKGEIWLMIGTHSAFRGTTTVYYTKVNAILSVTN